jgi:hypothetical protein
MTMTNEQLDEAVNRIVISSIKHSEAADVICQLWNAREKQRTELRNALYPGGIKHPQQAEWFWLIERAKEQREALVTLWKAAYEHWRRTESCGSCCNLDSLDELSKVLDDVLPYVKEEV